MSEAKPNKYGLAFLLRTTQINILRHEIISYNKEKFVHNCIFFYLVAKKK